MILLQIAKSNRKLEFFKNLQLQTTHPVCCKKQLVHPIKTKHMHVPMNCFFIDFVTYIFPQNIDMT